MKKLCMLVVVLVAAFCVVSAHAGNDEKITVKDITEEVLTGPSDLNPEKILGPGAIAIGTKKDILMSFGATVRIIPTVESDWDFGLSDEVDGYVNTEAVKSYAGGAYNMASAANELSIAASALDNAIGNSATFNGAGVLSAFEDFAMALNRADDVIGGSMAATAGAYQLTGNAQGAAVASGTASQITGLSQIASSVLASAQAAPDDATAAQIIAGSYQTAGAIPQLGGASLEMAAASISDSVVAKIRSDNPNATPEEALAYATVLKATADSFSPYYLANSFLKTHSNESGSVNDGYLRTEVKMYFNAMAHDKKWSFYGALEYDKPIDTDTVDNRGGKDGESSNFGLERLNASVELFDGVRLHGGWDIWGLDVIEAATMVYGDDNPGLWLKGKKDENIAYSMAWFKMDENDFQNSVGEHNGAADDDRDLFAGYLDYKFDGTDANKLRFFYAFDRIRDVPAVDLLGALAGQANLSDYAGITGGLPDTNAHTIGGYYLGNFGIVDVMLEGAYKFGSADNTGLEGVNNGISTIEYNDFDINAYALAGDVSFELKERFGWHSFKPHVGFMYTSGDDDPNDDELSGFTGITSGQRFSRAWGGENTIIGDTNLLLGTALYGYIPEFYGNGTPIFTGGLQNAAGNGNGRGDNPGLTMLSMGLTMRPKIFLIYRTNVNMFYWNEDFYVSDMVNPLTTLSLATGTKVAPTLVEAGFVGTEWDNELTLALSKNMFIKAQAAFFFPGETIKDVTVALSGGTEADEIAMRLATELIWNF